MPRGGPRNATPGKSYQNRTDLGGQNVVGPKPAATGKVPIQTAPNQAQGQATAQRQAQQVVPMGGAPSQPVQPLFAPTDRPDEPVTHGGRLGGGATDVSGLPANPIAEVDPSVQIIRALYMQNPRDEDLRMIVEELDKQGRI